MSDHAAFHANALAQALAQHLLAVHIDQLILQGRRTAVNNQNFHLCCLLYVFALPAVFWKSADRILQIPVFII